jgi:hypothetical protein
MSSTSKQIANIIKELYRGERVTGILSSPTRVTC